jgi:hypothetical protein
VKRQISALLLAATLPFMFSIEHAAAANQSAAAQDEAKKETSAPFVTIPPNYVYRKDDKSGLHDYCTDSPDKYPNPFGKNADFRGPCARHDLCLEAKTTPATCHERLRNDLITNCKQTYGRWNPVRVSCIETALVYWAAVTAKNPV